VYKADLSLMILDSLCVSTRMRIKNIFRGIINALLDITANSSEDFVYIASVLGNIFFPFILATAQNEPKIHHGCHIKTAYPGR
jgi:hypothetical protein